MISEFLNSVRSMQSALLNGAREYCEEEIGGGHSLYSLDCAQSSIFPCDCFERYS